MKRKRQPQQQQALQYTAKLQNNKTKLNTIIQKLKDSAALHQPHQFKPILQIYKQTKHPILQTLQPINQVYKTNPDKKKKPIQIYLDTVNNLYKKKDLDVLINPLSVVSVYQKWTPRQIAIFQLGILRFGKQFQFISELIKSKSVKQVYEFYLQWRGTTHYKSYKSSKTASNRSNYESYV